MIEAFGLDEDRADLAVFFVFVIAGFIVNVFFFGVLFFATVIVRSPDGLDRCEDHVIVGGVRLLQYSDNTERILLVRVTALGESVRRDELVAERKSVFLRHGAADYTFELFAEHLTVRKSSAIKEDGLCAHDLGSVVGVAHRKGNDRVDSHIGAEILNVLV